MATYTGVFSGRPNHELHLVVTNGSPNVDTNKTPISWALYAVHVSGVGSWSLTPAGSWSVNIGGHVVNGGAWSYDFRSVSSVLIGSGSVDVEHNPDGTLTLSSSASANSASTLGAASSGGSMVLPTIPRATVPTLTNSSRQIGQTTTINLPRASESFTHNITYQFGSLTGQIAGLSAHTGVGTSATFTVPTALVTEMVAQSSRTLTFTVVTMSGATVVGSKTVQLTVTPAGGSMYERPTVSASVVRALSDGTPDDDGECAKVSITAAVSSVLVSTEQNELSWKTEVSSDAGVSWAELGSGTVAAHGLTLNSATTYTDSDPGTGGTQPFSTTAGYLFRVTITDAFSSVAVQILSMLTAAALVDVYDGGGDPDASGLSVGALFNPSLLTRFQVGGVDALPATRTVSYTTSSLADGATETTELDLGVGFTILHFESSHATRFRAYQSAAHRSADASRAVGVLPSGDHGLIFEDDGSSVSDYATVAVGGLLDGETLCPVSITNRSGSTRAVTVTLEVRS